MTAATLDITGSAPIPFHRLVRVELRKSYDTRAGFWLIAVIGLLVVLVEGVVLAVTVVQDQPLSYGDTTAVAAFVTSVLLPVLGIMVVTSEWSQRTAMVTFALEPRRPHVIGAKAMVGVLLTVATIVFALVIGLITIGLYAALQGESPVWDFGWTGFVGFFFTQVLAMLTGFALATLLLNTPAAIVIFFVYTWVLPSLLMLGGALIGWFEDIVPWIDFQSAQAELYELPLSAEQWGHLVVSGGLWLGVPLVLGVLRVLRAEVK